MTFILLNNATWASSPADITITFSEAVRNESDDSDLTDSNVDSLITLKEDNAGGADIGKEVTINSGNTIITINPTDWSGSDCRWVGGEENVYVAIDATVEDSADNAITADNATFQSDKNAQNL